MGGRGSYSKTRNSGNSGNTAQMSAVRSIFNKEIEKFNKTEREFTKGTDNQRAATEQVKGLKEIFTSKINAKKSQDFSKRNNELYKEVNKLVSETKFEKIPKGAIVKGSKEYKERKQKGEVPKKAIVGVKDVTYNQISNASSSDKHRMKGEEPRNNMEKVLLKKEWYFNKK